MSPVRCVERNWQRAGAVSRVPKKRSKPKEWGRSEVKRNRAGSPHGEPRTEPPSEAAERSPPASTWHREETSPRLLLAGKDAVNIRCKEENDGRDPVGERLRIGDGKGEAERQTGFPGLL